ncbi:MAG: GNAT family N-acetyltransferase [Gallionella sp.]|jgi:CelD/BcsL family acetyltransferase involved in cellulose biosynthesis
MSNWQFEWITSWDEVWSDPHLERWQNLLDQANEPNVFVTQPLVRAWCLAAQQVQNVSPCFMWARTVSGLSVFMPLVIVQSGFRNAWLRVMQPVGLGEYDYHDPLFGVNNEVERSSFWQVFDIEISVRWGKKYDRAIFGGLRAQSFSNAVELADRAPYFVIERFLNEADFLSSRGQNLRGDIRRRLRRLEDLGVVSFRVFSPEETEAALNVLPELLSQHAARWPNSYRLPGFHASLIREALPVGFLHLSEVCVGDIIISRHLGFFYKRRFYWYMPVNNPKYDNYSPGKLLLYFCAVDAIKKGGALFDLLRGEETYKSQWADGVEDLYVIKQRGTGIFSKIQLALVDTIKPILFRIFWIRKS